MTTFPGVGSDGAGHAPEAGGDSPGHGSSDVDTPCSGAWVPYLGGRYCLTRSKLEFLISRQNRKPTFWPHRVIHHLGTGLLITLL